MYDFNNRMFIAEKNNTRQISDIFNFFYNNLNMFIKLKNLFLIIFIYFLYKF